MTPHWRLRRRLRFAAVLGIGLFIVLAIPGLAACGYSSSTQRSTSSTQAQKQTTYHQVQVQKCGVVQGLGSLKVPPSDNGAQQSENCFWHAFQHCLPATLIFSTSGVDTALLRTFTIHNNNG